VNGAPSPAMMSRDIGETLAIILALGIAGEVIVPWAVIELSNLVVFDVPSWALWPIFAGPITLALATALVVWLLDKDRPPRPGHDCDRQRAERLEGPALDESRPVERRA
jgi:hypothetical protein